MKQVLKGLSYVLHPLFIPTITTAIYFWISTRYSTDAYTYSKMFSIFILTCLVPLVVFNMLKLTGSISSIHLPTARERRTPLIAYILLIALIIRGVLYDQYFVELYFFFIGVVFSSLSALVLVLLDHKTSLHMISMGGIWMFLIPLGLQFGLNLMPVLAITTLLVGAVATSRLLNNAHSPAELVTGLFIGIVPQLIMLNFYL